MSSIPALPIRRALLAKTTPDRNITTTPTKPRTTDLEKVKNMNTRARNEHEGRPDAVPTGVPVDGLRTNPFREVRILLIEGLFQLVENPLFVLREWQQLVLSNRACYRW